MKLVEMFEPATVALLAALLASVVNAPATLFAALCTPDLPDVIPLAKFFAASVPFVLVFLLVPFVSESTADFRSFDAAFVAIVPRI
ncbi:MAG: hypothetical protein Q4B09_05020, partial [Lachnospiraceae bacterium]|nr:hypothetical protein [Lachnospiraceae bacterium]